jgi:hypothetical protein
VLALEVIVQGLGFRGNNGLGLVFRVIRLGITVWGFGLRVKGVGCGVE